jgi:hypothetical protein
MNFEDEIRAALRRQEPPAGFAERVLARTGAAGETPRATPIRRSVRPPWIRWAAAMAACAVLSAGAWGYRYYQGERAKAQVILALRITANKLNKAQQRVRMLNGHRNNS